MPRAVRPLLKYRPATSAPSNCGVPSRVRSQSVSPARTRTASLPKFVSVMGLRGRMAGPGLELAQSGAATLRPKPAPPRVETPTLATMANESDSERADEGGEDDHG